MSNWGDSLIQGFQAVTDAKEKKKSREQQAQLEAAHQALQLDLAAKQIQSQRDLQNDRIAADASSMFNRQTWQGGENEKDRGFRTSERLGSEGFQGGQSEKDRTFRTSERIGTEGFQGGQANLDRKQKEAIANAQLLMDAQKLKNEREVSDAGLGFKGQQFEWAKDPMNPDNVFKSAHAKYLAGNTVPDLPGLPNPNTSLRNGQPPGGLPSPTSKEERDKLPPGSRYIGPDGNIYTR